MSLDANYDDDRLDLLHQIVLQCQIDHLERCWILSDEAVSEPQTAENYRAENYRLDNEPTLDRFEDFLLESFMLLDPGFSPCSEQENKDWLEDLLVRFLIDSF